MDSSHGEREWNRKVQINTPSRRRCAVLWGKIEPKSLSLQTLRWKTFHFNPNFIATGLNLFYAERSVTGLNWVGPYIYSIIFLRDVSKTSLKMKIFSLYETSTIPHFAFSFYFSVSYSRSSYINERIEK